MTTHALTSAALGAALLLSAGLGLSGCASIGAARMALPAEVSRDAEIQPITGIGGGRAGRFTVGEHQGAFLRSASRLTFFDVLTENSGRTRFTLAGPSINSEIEADCTMGERVITVSVVSWTPKWLAYRCSFKADGQSIPARFELQETRESPGTALMKKERRGEIALERVVLQFRSSHDLEGSSIQMGTPIGYIFERDGVPVGAVEINGTPRVFLPKDTDVATRRAILAGSLALGLFWDPASVGGDDGR